MLTIADGGGVQEPPILADVICEQPLMHMPRTPVIQFNISKSEQKTLKRNFSSYFCIFSAIFNDNDNVDVQGETQMTNKTRR